MATTKKVRRTSATTGSGFDPKVSVENVFRLAPPRPSSLDRTLVRSRAARLTYEPVGATASEDLPDGFRHERRELLIGDASCFERAKEGLSRWQAHIGAGAKVYPSDVTVAEGETVLVLIGLGPLHVIAPCRVVYVVDTEDRFGFGYGTLPGHPESGEESFVLELGHRGTVFSVTAFSRPSGLMTRVGAPVARGIQARFTDRYLRALAQYAAGDGQTWPGGL
jgi:uncharacterized protein (UPF0548 family)